MQRFLNPKRDIYVFQMGFNLNKVFSNDGRNQMN